MLETTNDTLIPSADKPQLADTKAKQVIDRDITIGILALQGDFDAHAKIMDSLPGVSTMKVRTPEDLDRCDALVLPGGESTTVAKLLIRNGLMDPLRLRLANGMPAFGTCAGLILLSDKIVDRPDQPTIGALTATVDRNAFGRQVDSFEADLPFPLPEDAGAIVRAVFIRAPYVTEVRGIARVLSEFEGRIVAVQQGSILGIAFHPELTGDPRVHAYFAAYAAANRENR